MTPIDPIFVSQFGWADDLDPASLMTDPEAAAKAVASYIDNPDYRFADVETRDVLIDGPLGEKSLPIRLYGRSATADSSALVWAHGGGFVAGGLDDNEADGVSRELSARAGVPVVSVGYHLADGTIGYPTLHREVGAAFAWLRANAGELGVDPESIVLGGASAGANLALAAALEARDEGRAAPSGLVLVYPALHVAPPEGIDAPDLTGVPNLLRIPAPLLAYMFQAYVGSYEGAATYAAPGSFDDVRGLPEVLVLAAEFDDLRPSAVAFSHAAQAAGVEVREILVEGAAHGYLAMTPDVRANDVTLNEISRFVRRDLR